MNETAIETGTLRGTLWRLQRRIRHRPAGLQLGTQRRNASTGAVGRGHSRERVARALESGTPFRRPPFRVQPGSPCRHIDVVT
jgi:hypothetical protein